MALYSRTGSFGVVSRLLLYFLGWTTAGLLFGGLPWWLLIGALGLLGWHYIQLQRLQVWLHKGHKLYPPQSTGIWGNVLYGVYLLQVRNRSRRRRLASLLRRFRRVISALPDGAVMLDSQGEILWCGEMAGPLLGLQWPQDNGQRLVNLVRDPKFTEYLESNQFDQPITINSPKDRLLHLEVRVVPYGQRQNLLIARDVTQLVNLEQTRRDFVANVSHELKTPLTVVRGYLETMSDSDLDPMWLRAISLMGDQTQRMSQLIDQLLVLSRLENTSNDYLQRTVDIPSMLQNIIRECQVLSGERKHNIELLLECDCSLKGNESELRSAFLNLVANAVHYTPDGGNILVHWRAQTLKSQDGESTSAVLSVVDDGVGISVNDLPRLTERFYRVDKGRSRDTGGSGLGLAIVKHAVRRNSGELKITSELGQGSNFSCHFSDEVVSKPAVSKCIGRT
ncbi:phosphate regulon sensor histidine kinase PhoR [Pelagibaculum spongiae]|nr:phosphate regulon sensor histidine kinase PhoR [Pelagibaculum spongiae]